MGASTPLYNKTTTSPLTLHLTNAKYLKLQRDNSLLDVYNPWCKKTTPYTFNIFFNFKGTPPLLVIAAPWDDIITLFTFND